MKLFNKNLLLLALALLIMGLPLFLRIAPEYSGTDSLAVNLINEVDPTYQPWFSNLVKLPGSEMESLLFALQAALGAGVLGFILGRLTGRPHADMDAEKPINKKGQTKNP